MRHSYTQLGMQCSTSVPVQQFVDGTIRGVSVDSLLTLASFKTGAVAALVHMDVCMLLQACVPLCLNTFVRSRCRKTAV